MKSGRRADMHRGPVLLVVLLLTSVAAADATAVHTLCDKPATDQVESETLSLLSLNISHGRAMALNQLLVSKQKVRRNVGLIANVLARVNADVVALQEADGVSRWSGGFDHVAAIADQAGYGCMVHGLHSRGFLSDYGTALLTNARQHAARSVPFSPTPPSKQKGFVAAQVHWQGVSITVVSVHMDFLRRSNRRDQIERMIEELAGIDGELVVLGDLNSEWQARDSQVRRLADELGLHAYRPDSDALGTYKKPGGKRLDWILLSSGLEFTDYQVLPDIVADHFAVHAIVRPTSAKE